MAGIFNTGRPQPRGRGRGTPVQRAAHLRYQQQQQQQQQQPQAIPYNDFQLLSCARKGSKTNLIDFKDAHKNINMADFSRPIKLHRKEPAYMYYNRLQQQQQQQQQEQQQQQQQGGNVDKDGNANTSSTAETFTPTEIIESTPQQRYERYQQQQQGPKTGADTSLIAPMGGASKNKTMMFKKRTRQIYLAKEDTRELKEQEHRPWILEDFNGTNSFTGTLEGGQRSDYVLFVLTDSGFKVVPLDRWYKFQRKRHIRTLTAEEVEEQMKKERKQTKSDNNRWMMLKRGEEEELGDSPSSAAKPKFRIVDTDDTKRAGSDDEGGGKRHDSDIDDLDFDDVFQDDEEGGNEHEMEDEDIKDGKERIKKEHKGYAPNQDEEDEEAVEESRLTSEGKQMRKLVRDLEKNRAYESDEDKDPYATSEEELESDVEEDEDGSDKEGKDNKQASQQQQTQQDSGKHTSTLKKKATLTKPALKKGLKKKESMSRPIGRPGSPSMKREASPSSPPRTTIMLARSGSSSPKASSPSSPSGTENASVLKKRKVNDHEHRSSKQQRVTSPQHQASPTSSQSDDSSLITEEEVVETLRGRTMSTKDFLMRFRKRIKKNERNRDIITALLKRVARHNVTSDPSQKMLELKPELA